MSDLGFNVWGVVTGAIGLLSLLPAAWIYSRFPSRKLRVLELTMDETITLFSKGLEAGLHTQKDDLRVFSSNIWVINQRIDDMRGKVIALRTWRAQLKGWWDGVSGDIDILHDSIDELRVQLSASSSRDRRRLAAEGYTHDIAEVLAARSRERLLSVTSPLVQEDAFMQFDAKSDAGGEHQDTTKPYLVQTHQKCPPLPLPRDDASRIVRPLPTSARPQAETAPIIEDVSTHSQPSLDIGTSHTRGNHRQYRSMRRATLRQFSKNLCASPSSEPSCHVHRPLLRWDVCRDPARTPSGPLRGNHYGIYGRHSAQPASLGCNALPNPERAENHAYEGDDEGEGEEGARLS